MSSKPSGCTILIVENNPECRKQIKLSLQKDTNYTYSFIEHSTYAAALLCLRATTVHIIFLAEQLPNASALNYLASLRAIKQCQDIPIFVTLNTESQSTVTVLLHAGAQFCLSLAQTTPLMLQQLLHCALKLKENEQALAANKKDLVENPNAQLEERLRLAFETAGMGYWEWDIQADRVRWRHRAEEIFGLQDDQFDGSMDNVLAMIHPEDRDKIKQALHASMANGTDYQFEFRVGHEEQDIRWLLGNGRTFFSDGRKPVLMIGVLRDITERRKTEARLEWLLAEARLAKESAENANRAKDEFIAQITHDLRSPLSAVLGWAKVLKNKKDNEQLRDEAIQTIIESAEKQTNLIEDLLDISRVSAGKLRLDVRPVSLSAVIRSAMDVMQPACDAKEINCTTELATEADAVTGDPTRLEQVIWNLVANAVKFTPNKGQVKVRLERADPYVRITISDTGQGIKAEHLPLIFERYWQPDSFSGKRKAGLGLGLSLVKHIIELHGGTVSVQSEGENKGASFVINLPYRAVRLQQQDAPAVPVSECDLNVDSRNDDLILAPALSSSALEGVMIAVVDDEPSARELVAEILRQHGATVATAESARAAYDIVTNAERVPDLLVSDISMPEEDGYMLIRKIRRLPRNKGGAIPAIALTAFGRMEDRVKALSAGFQMHLPKPVEPAELALVAANLTNREIINLV